MSLMGVDIGTTGCKAVVFSERGEPLAGHAEEYPMYYGAGGRCELDPEEVWAAVRQAIGRTAAATPAADPVRAVGLSTLGDSVTPIDRAGRALAPTLTGHLDVRATEQAEWLVGQVGRENLFRLTGVAVHSMNVVPKAMWFRQRQPEVYGRTWKFAGWQELAQVRLGLDPVMDYSLGGRTLALNIRTKDWNHDLLALCGLDAGQFCPPAQATTVAGQIDASRAETLGLRAGVPVVAGSFDQSCAALGAGVLEPGTAGLSIGTGECATAVFDRCLLTPPLLEGGHGCGFYAIDGLYISLADMVTSGALLRWYRDTLGEPETRLARQQNLDPYEVILGRAPDRPARVFVLPYFSGAGTPWQDPRQRGTIFGLTLDTDRDEIVKGLLDGLCCELRLNLESMQRAGLQINGLRAAGGGARSERWMQLKADITGVPIETMQVREAGCLGAAFLAGLGTGVYGSARDILSISRVKRAFHPNTGVKAQYDDAYQTYCLLRSRVEGLRL